MSAQGGAAPSTSGAKQKDKSPADDQSAHIIVKVNSQDGTKVFFKIKRTSPLRKLMTAYCDRQSMDSRAVAFLFDGRRIRGEQTPDELEMQDQDEIDAMLHQTGGACGSAQLLVGIIFEINTQNKLGRADFGVS